MDLTKFIKHEVKISKNKISITLHYEEPLTTKDFMNITIDKPKFFIRVKPIIGNWFSESITRKIALIEPDDIASEFSADGKKFTVHFVDPKPLAFETNDKNLKITNDYLFMKIENFEDLYSYEALHCWSDEKDTYTTFTDLIMSTGRKKKKVICDLNYLEADTDFIPDGLYERIANDMARGICHDVPSVQWLYKELGDVDWGKASEIKEALKKIRRKDLKLLLEDYPFYIDYGM